MLWIKIEKILNTVFPDSGEVIIALHNNFKGYNVKLEIPKSDTISIKKDQNPRDFYLCTKTEKILKFLQNLLTTLPKKAIQKR